METNDRNRQDNILCPAPLDLPGNVSSETLVTNNKSAIVCTRRKEKELKSNTELHLRLLKFFLAVRTTLPNLMDFKHYLVSSDTQLGIY